MASRQGGKVVDEDTAKVTTILANHHEHALVGDDANLDETTLAALGYKQEFKRDFTIWTSFSVSFSVLGLLPSIASSLYYSLGYSGTAGAVWGWLIAALMIQSVAFSMAELCSSMPTAGGLYYASAVLAPEGWGPLAAWIVGWSNFLGFVVTGTCSINYALADMLVTAGQIAYPSYTIENWHIYLVLLALLISQGLISMQPTKFVGKINGAGTIINLIIVFIFLIWFPVGSINDPKTNPSQEVWTKFENTTEWPIGWATIMGFLTTIYTMCGYDAPFHLAEECSNANIVAPRAIVLTAQFGLYLGFAIILVIAYTVKNIGFVLSGGQPFGNLCLQVLGKNSGLAMFALNIIAQFFCGQGVLIAATRVAYAYSRDGAIVGSRWWSKVDQRTRTPVIATWGIVVISALLGLLLFGGPVTIDAIFSITAMGQYTAFTVPIFLKLLSGRKRFRPGPWNLGRFSVPVNIAACAWWLLIVPALCFPAYKGKDLTPQYMNWTCLIYGGSMFFALSYYAIDGRKWFRGPRINIAHVDGEPATSGLSHDSDEIPEKEG